jgi:hypothetical protein
MPTLRVFVVLGAVLVATGVLQAFVRPRRPHEVGVQRYLNRGTIWAAFCVVVGVAGILVGLGVIAVPVHGAAP